MAVRIGGKEIQNIYVGNREITKVYAGSQLVYRDGALGDYRFTYNPALSFDMLQRQTVPRVGTTANFRANRWGRGLTSFPQMTNTGITQRILLCTSAGVHGHTLIHNYRLDYGSGAPAAFDNTSSFLRATENRFLTTATDKPDDLLTVAGYRANEYIDGTGRTQRWFIRWEGNVGTDNQGSNFNGAATDIWTNPGVAAFRASTDLRIARGVTLSSDTTVDYYIRTWVPFGQNFLGVTLRPRQVNTKWTQAQQIRFDLMDFDYGSNQATMGVRSVRNTIATDDGYSTASGLTLNSLGEDWNAPEQQSTFVPGTTTPEDLPNVRKFQAVFHETESPDQNKAVVRGKLFLFGTTGIPADGLDTETTVFGTAVAAEDATRAQVGVENQIYVYDIESNNRGEDFGSFTRDTATAVPRALSIPGVATEDFGISDICITSDARYLFVADHLRQRVECFDFYDPPTG